MHSVWKSFAKLLNLDEPSDLKLRNAILMRMTGEDRKRWSRHEELIKEIRSLHARIRLIPDGDACRALSTCKPNSGIDLLMGIGGSPEAVITACAGKCVWAEICSACSIRAMMKKRDKCREYGMDYNKVLELNDLVSCDNVFFATGVSGRRLGKGRAMTAM